MSQAARDEPHGHSGWWLPVAVLAAVALLCGLFLLYDLRPAPGTRDGARTADTAPVQLSVRGLELSVPANYLDSRATRQGGEQDVITLSVLLPDMRGFTQSDARLFTGNAPDSPVVHLLLKADQNDLDAAGRLQRIYGPYLQNMEGVADDFGLRRYAFRADSGYGREDLYAGTAGGRLLLFLCERADPNLASPNCLAVGRPVGRQISLSWRFKRAYLSRWAEIASGVETLLTRFQDP